MGPCETCMFYTGDDYEGGSCRRYPPALIVVPKIASEYEAPVWVASTQFPEVFGIMECGEWMEQQTDVVYGELAAKFSA